MLPLALPMWETDGTARVALQSSVVNDVPPAGNGALLLGGEATFDVRALDPAATYTFFAHGAYARIINVALAGGADAPSDAVSAEVRASSAWTVTPQTRWYLDVGGYFATRLGVRAFDDLAARDPFLGNRLEYTLAPTTEWSTILSRRSSFRASAGYVQAGALHADDPNAVGVDAHTGAGQLAYSYELTRSDVVTPELHYAYTHYYHALLDVNLDTGPADVHAGTALLGETHAFARRWIGFVAGGLTVATPPPLVQAHAALVAPEARATMSYVGQRHGASASYIYSYTSLGPRVGYGQTHAGVLELTVEPLAGASYRDVVVHAIARANYGATPVAANPELGVVPMTASSLTGTVTTFSVAGGLRLEWPLRRGLSLLGGFDLEYLNAVVDPMPVGGGPGSSFITTATLGLVGTLSTDPRRMIRPEPALDERELERRSRPDASPADRLDDLDATPGPWEEELPDPLRRAPSLPVAERNPEREAPPPAEPKLLPER